MKESAIVTVTNSDHVAAHQQSPFYSELLYKHKVYIEFESIMKRRLELTLLYQDCFKTFKAKLVKFNQNKQVDYHVKQYLLVCV